jgi:O-antigen/teichoic acid export membrane protein
LNSISNNVVTRIDKILLSYFCGASTVAYYSIPYLLSSTLSSFVGSVNNFIFPGTSYLLSKENYKVISRNFLKFSAYTALLSGSLLIPFILISDSFIQLWMGTNFSHYSYGIAPILGVIFFFSSIASVALWYYTALGYTKINLLSSCTGAFFFLAAAYILLPLFNIKGAALSFAFIHIPLPFYIIYLLKKIGLDLLSYLKVIFPWLVAIFIAFLIRFVSPDEISYNMFFMILLSFIIFLFIYIYYIYFHKEFISELFKIVKGIFNKAFAEENSIN